MRSEPEGPVDPDDPDGPGDPPVRSSWGLITSRNFGTFFAARFLTSIGCWLQAIVSAIAAFEATGSALVVGVVSTVQFLPQVVFGPLLGRWADSGSIKLQMILGRAFVVASALALAVWYLAAAGADPAADATAIIAGSVVFGVGLVLSETAQQSAAPHLVRPAEIPSAVALSTAPSTIGRIIGPAFGAVFIAWLGYGPAFLIGALLNIAFMVLISLVVFPARVREPQREKNSMREAIAYVRGDRPVLLSLVGVFAVSIGSEAIVTLAPSLAAELGGEAATVGLLVAMAGVGSAVGILISSTFAQQLRQDRTAFVGLALMALMLGLCFFRMPQLWAVVAFTVTGLGYMIAQTSLNTIVQMRLPPAMRGRIVALWLIGFAGSRPIGSVVIGGVADATSVHVAFAATAALVLLVGWFLRPSRLRD